MEEEFEPKRKSDEVKEIIKEEKEEIKEINSNKKGKIKGIIYRIISVIILLILIFEVVIGILNTQRINDNKEPIWCFSNETKKENNQKETICHLGLYVIVKTEDDTETRTSLKPFFLK